MLLLIIFHHPRVETHSHRTLPLPSLVLQPLPSLLLTQVLRSPVHLVCASANASPTAYIAYQYEVWPKFRPACSPQVLQPLIICVSP